METEINGPKETAQKSACTNMANGFLTKMQRRFNSTPVEISLDQHFTFLTHTHAHAQINTERQKMNHRSLHKALNYKSPEEKTKNIFIVFKQNFQTLLKTKVQSS